MNLPAIKVKNVNLPASSRNSSCLVSLRLQCSSCSSFNYLEMMIWWLRWLVKPNLERMISFNRVIVNPKPGHACNDYDEDYDDNGGGRGWWWPRAQGRAPSWTWRGWRGRLRRRLSASSPPDHGHHDDCNDDDDDHNDERNDDNDHDDGDNDHDNFFHFSRYLKNNVPSLLQPLPYATPQGSCTLKL